MIIVMATIVSKPEGRKAMEPLVMECISETRKEKGCISYELFSSLEEENSAIFIERWSDKESLDAHMQTTHFKKFISGSESLLAKAPEIKIYNANEIS